MIVSDPRGETITENNSFSNGPGVDDEEKMYFQTPCILHEARRIIFGCFTKNTKEIQRESKGNPAREARRKRIGVVVYLGAESLDPA